MCIAFHINIYVEMYLKIAGISKCAICVSTDFYSYCLFCFYNFMYWTIKIFFWSILQGSKLWASTVQVFGPAQPAASPLFKLCRRCRCLSRTSLSSSRSPQQTAYCLQSHRHHRQMPNLLAQWQVMTLQKCCCKIQVVVSMHVYR